MQARFPTLSLLFAAGLLMIAPAPSAQPLQGRSETADHSLTASASANQDDPGDQDKDQGEDQGEDRGDVQDDDLNDDWGDAWGDDWSEDTDSGWQWTGFVEMALGRRIHDQSVVDDDATLEELRLRLETERYLGESQLRLKLDGYYDGVTGSWEGDLRELTWQFSPSARSDLTIGRQVITWGTGDFVFLNDLFPKDFQAFFSGRDDDYLKAPADALRWSRFGDRFNLDLVWMPEFESDRYLTGERFSFFSPLAGATLAPSPPLAVAGPNRFPEDGELAMRAYRTAGSVEYAAYGYLGRFKQPLGMNENGPSFPRLNVWGASLRRPVGGGLLNAEVAWYDSREDSEGRVPGIPNSQIRALLGWEQEVARNTTLGLQAYLEHTLDHDALIEHSRWPQFEPDRNRTVLTARLTHLSMQQRLTGSLFLFASPSDHDWHLRPRLAYRKDDRWLYTLGANLFGGKDPHTFFNQLDGNDNVYVRIRYHF